MGLFDVGGISAKLGANVDPKGFVEFDRAVAAADKKTAKAKLSVDVDRDSFNDADRELTLLQRAYGGAQERLKAANQEAGFLLRLAHELKLDVLLGAGVASEGVKALSAGVIGLTAALAPLSGALVAYPQLLTAFGQVAGTVAVAGINDLTEAYGGNKEALKRLTPEAKDFLDTIKGYKPEFDGIKKAVQSNLFGGLDKGLDAAMKNAGPLRRVLAGTADVLGDLGARAGKIFGREGFGRDFEKIGKQNTQIIERLGNAGLDFAMALRHVLIEARPFTDWLSKTIEGFSKFVNRQAQAARETGAIRDFFRDTRQTMKQVFSIVTNLGSAFGEMGKAARPVGDWILNRFNQISKHLAEWTHTAEGEHTLAHYFEDAKKPLAESGKLIGAIGASILELSEGDSLPKFLKLLRTELLPVITELSEHAIHMFSDPGVMDAFAQFIRLSGTLLGMTEPFRIFVEVLGRMAGALNAVFDASPLIKNATLTLFGFYTVLKTIGLLKGLSDLFGFGKGLTTVTDNIGPANKAVSALGDHFSTLKTQIGVWALDAKDKAKEWGTSLIGGIKGYGSKVGDAVKGALTKGRAATSAAISTVGEFVGSIVGRFGSSKLGQKLAPFFKSVAGRMGAIFAATVAAAVAIGEGVGGLAGSLVGKLKSSGLVTKLTTFARDTGKKMGPALLVGLILSLPLLVPKAWEFGKKIGTWIKKAILDNLPSPQEIIRAIVPGAGPVADALKGAMGVTTLPPQPSEHPGASDTIIQDIGGAPPRKPGRGGQNKSPLDGVDDDTKKRGKEIRDEVEKTYKDSSDKAEKGNKKIADDTEKQGKRAADSTERQTKRQRRDVDDSYDAQARKVRDRGGDMAKYVDDSFTRQVSTAIEKGGKFRDSVKQTADSSADATKTGMNLILNQVNKALKAFGIDPVTFGASKSDEGKDQPGTAVGGGRAGQTNTAAVGGVLAGYSRFDDRTIKVRGGEAILRPEDQIPFVDATMRMMHGFGLFDYMRASGSKMGFAAGGIVPIPGFPGESIDRRILPDVLRLTKAYKQFVTDGYSLDEVHAANGEHPLGLATDLVPNSAAGGTWNDTDALAAWAEPVQNQPIAPFRWVGYNGDAGHGRGNHLHLSWQHGPGNPAEWVSTLGGKKIGIGLPGGNIKKIKITGPDGPFKSVAQGAVNRVRKGAQKYLQRKSIATAGEMGGANFLPPSGGGALSRNQIRGLLTANKMPDIMGYVSYAESGFNPSLTNPTSGAAGLWQFLPSTWAGLGVPGSPYNPPQAAVGAAKLYGQAGLGPWAASKYEGQGGGWGQHLGEAFASGGVVPYGALYSAQAPTRWSNTIAGMIQAVEDAGFANSPYWRTLKWNQVLADYNASRAAPYVAGAEANVATALTSGFNSLAGAAAFGSPIEGGIAALLSNPSGAVIPERITAYAQQRIAALRATSRIGAAQSRVLAGFSRGGVVSGGGGQMIVQPIVHVTPVFEGDASALDYRTKTIVVRHAQAEGQAAGLARQTAGAPGRRASY